MRVIIVAGPRRGKSTTASALGLPIFCGDPLSKVKDPMEGVTYLPEDLPFAGDGGSSDYIATNWFSMPGPWVCEGHVMARALRRWVALKDRPKMPCDKIIVLDHAARIDSPLRGQEAMHKGVMKVWGEIAHHFKDITQLIKDPEENDARLLFGHESQRSPVG